MMTADLIAIPPMQRSSAMSEHTDERVSEDDLATASSDRRSLLRKVAIGGAGAAAATLAVARPASAGDQAGPQINGNAVELGETNTAAAATIVDVTPASAPTSAGPSALSVGGYAPGATSPFPAAVGGYGDNTVVNGLHGSTTDKTGFGVVAASLAAEPTDTEAPPVGLAVASAKGPQIKFVTLEQAVEGPTKGKHAAGEMYVDKLGTLWFTVPAATTTAPDAVRFVKLAGSSTSGAFHALPIAKRIYDSREVPGGTKLDENTQIDIDLTKAADGTPSGLPAGARLAVVNLAITQTEVAGFIVLFAAGTPIAEVRTANINWSEAGVATANSATIPVSADGKITARAGGGTGDNVTARAHFIIDLVAYYL
jgi:hypothetical protein